MKSSVQNWKPGRVLIRSVNWLGDAVMTMPAIESIRRGWPDASISILTHPKLGDLWRMQSFVDEVIESDKEESILKLGRRLREKKFDAAIVLPNSPRTALEMWFAGIPFRGGYGGGFRGLMLSAPVERRSDVVHMKKRTPAEVKKLADHPELAENSPIPVASHHVSHYLHLVQSLGFDGTLSAPALEASEDSQTDWVDTYFTPDQKAQLSKGTPLIGLNPGADYGPAKRWPTNQFIESAATVNEAKGGLYVVFGGPGDEVGEQVAKTLGIQIGAEKVINLVGKTSLGELLAGLARCDVVLTNDSGPMHVAAALGTEIVGVFGSTSVELTGPGMPGAPSKGIVQEKVSCAPCFLRECPIDFRCMESVQVEAVVDRINKAIEVH